MTKIPAHWPKDIVYLSDSTFHTSVDTETRRFVKPSQSRNNADTSGSKAGVIHAIRDANHPACGQNGLFALKKIPPKTHILDYIGEIHCDDRPMSDYDLCLHRFQSGCSVGIDASRMGNEARFVNDFRGIKDKPNAVFMDARDTSGELQISVYSSHEGIKKGDEILVSYGKSWWKACNNNEDN